MNDVNVSAQGRLSWELLSAGGVVLQAGEQSNLITDAGLDQMANGFFAVQNVCSVGTGNTAPSFADTALVGPVGSSSTSAEGDGTVTRPSPGVHAARRVVEFQQNEANGNLTEWGFSSGPGTIGGQSIGVRELFRDGAGNPVVVTKTAETKLRMAYTLTLNYGPVEPVDTVLTLAGVGPLNTRGRMLDGGGQTKSDFAFLQYLVLGYGSQVVAHTDPTLRDASYQTYVSPYGFGPVGIGINTTPPYVPGSHSRGSTILFDTDRGNGTITGFSFVTNGATYPDGTRATLAGFIQYFLPGQELVKDSLHRLTLTGPSISWGRTPPAQIN